jgi:hypothetical protein
MYTRICPKCKKEISHKSIESGRRQEGKQCWACAQADPKKAERVSLTNKGKSYNKSRLGIKESLETRQKKSQALKGRQPGFGGKKHSAQTRQKMSTRRAELLQQRFGHGQLSPFYNKDACILFEEINREMNWMGLHAENGGEFYIGGYWLDYYEPNENIVIEFDEGRHSIPSIMEKDRIKQEYVTSVLKCKFIRIKQEEKHLWKTLIL